MKSTKDRLLAKVEKTGSCWNWKGAKFQSGYGQMKVEGKVLRAHRISYELAKGRIPPEMELDHLCQNKACVNPDHLEAVSHKENMRRSSTNPTTANSKKTHCPSGHPYSEENTKVYRGYRYCKECINSKRKIYV